MVASEDYYDAIVIPMAMIKTVVIFRRLLALAVRYLKEKQKSVREQKEGRVRERFTDNQE